MEVNNKVTEKVMNKVYRKYIENIYEVYREYVKHMWKVSRKYIESIQAYGFALCSVSVACVTSGGSALLFLKVK